MEPNINSLISEIDEYAIFSLDLNGYINSWNLGAKKIKGYDEDEIIGQHVSIFYTLQDQQEGLAKTLLENALKHKKVVNEGWRIRKNGEQFWASITITAIHFDNKIIGFTKITRDLTERKLLMDNLLEAKQKAEESSNIKSAFLATINHELRTPLNHIIEFSKFIEETTTNNDILEYSKIINTSGQNLLVIIENILNIAQMKNDKIKIINQSLNIGDLFDDIVNAAMESLTKYDKENTIKLKTEINYNKILNKQFLADRYKIQQIVNNLVDNAVKFTEQGTLTIAFDQTSETKFSISIKDTGIGIPSEKQALIFDYFTQADDSLSRPFEGIGAGLTIANLIAKAVGGKITLKSELKKGSTFTFTFPFKV